MLHAITVAVCKLCRIQSPKSVDLGKISEDARGGKDNGWISRQPSN